ncbi:7642_t:CDS:2, partial [Paraglomus brasilianum]
MFGFGQVRNNETADESTNVHGTDAFDFGDMGVDIAALGDELDVPPIDETFTDSDMTNPELLVAYRLRPGELEALASGPSSNPTRQEEVQEEVPVNSVQVPTTEAVDESVAVSEPNPEKIAQLTSLKKCLQQYRSATLRYRKAQNLQRVQQMLRVYDSINQQIKTLESGGQLATGFVLPAEPDLSDLAVSQPAGPSLAPAVVPPAKLTITTPAAPAASTPTRPVSASTPRANLNQINVDAVNSVNFVDEDRLLSTMSKQEQYEHLLSKLKSQIELCQTLMKYYYKTGNKNTAALYLRFKKVFMADYDSLASLRDHNQNIPAYHFQEVTYTVENAFLEL